MVQATEVLKYFLGMGELLAGRLMIWDGLQARAEEIGVERNPGCEACGCLVTKNTALVMKK
jgi:adenylyltransferase/sulfurtransferase